jgi:hypothetical protein
MEGEEMTKALDITTVTLVGYNPTKYPTERGNCFSVRADDGSGYRIVNFSYENLQELIRCGISLPLEIRILDHTKGVAVIHDSRIPDEWYDKTFCEVCCPEALLPTTQKLRHERQEARGERVVGNSVVTINMDKRPRVRGYDPQGLRVKWTAMEGQVVSTMKEKG